MKPNTPGTMAKATGMMKGSAPNPMSMGAVAKGASLAPLAPLSMPLGMPPFQVAGPLLSTLSGLWSGFLRPGNELTHAKSQFLDLTTVLNGWTSQAKGAMPGANGGILPKALGPKMPGMPGMDLPSLPGMGNMGGCGMGGSMGSGLGKGEGKGEGGEVQDQVMLQMQMQMQMMMMGAMMGSMLGEGDEKKGKKKKKDKKNDADDDLPPGPSSDLSHPSYRPPDMEHIPGITDRRFEGKITMWLEAWT